MAVTLLRNSERQAFLACRQKWWWAYEERLRPKVAAPALRFGTLIHRALELRYPPGTTRGPHPAETFERLYQDELKSAYAMGFRDDEGKWHDAGAMGHAMMTNFVDEYDEDEEYEVIASEMPIRGRVGDVVVIGMLDGLWRHRRSGHLLMVDWKTTTQFWTQHLPLDEQAGTYWAIAPSYLRKKKILLPGQSIQGILYTFMRKAMPDDRPRNTAGEYLNKDGTVSKKQPAPYFLREITYRDKFERSMILSRIAAEAQEMQMVREGRLSLYKVPGQRNCSMCPFRDPCELHETGADYDPLFRSFYEKHDPYDQYNIENENRELIYGD